MGKAWRYQIGSVIFRNWPYALLMLMSKLGLIGNWNCLNLMGDSVGFMEILGMNTSLFLSIPFRIVTTMIWGRSSLTGKFYCSTLEGWKFWVTWWTSNLLVEAREEKKQSVQESWKSNWVLNSFRSVPNYINKLVHQNFYRYPLHQFGVISSTASLFQARMPHSQNHLSFLQFGPFFRI